jgi:hypothetical protein
MLLSLAAHGLEINRVRTRRPPLAPPSLTTPEA